MTNDQIRVVLADLSAAQSALKDSSRAFDTAMAGMRQALDGIADTNHAQGHAIDAVIAATEKALQGFAASGHH
jgi:hypothetical protein